MKDYDKICICAKCPSYVECKDIAFCVKRKSKCIKQERGCICGGCPVHKELKLKNGYYCTRDNEEKQNEKE